jgi:hypothetical protein
MRRPGLTTVPSARIVPVSGRDRAHERDLELERRRADALVEQRLDRQPHAAVEHRGGQPAMHRALPD